MQADVISSSFYSLLVVTVCSMQILESSKKQLQFDLVEALLNKHEIMYTGKSNLHCQHLLMGSELGVSSQGKEL